mmetsp:Transcript_24707/g.73141  ORF Transcript_24707/g.73141 Transcript_24707/m.73141 type:complete len:430 (+) Transcript_24707:121-1410(+)
MVTPDCMSLHLQFRHRHPQLRLQHRQTAVPRHEQHRDGVAARLRNEALNVHVHRVRQPRHKQRQQQRAAASAVQRLVVPQQYRHVAHVRGAVVAHCQQQPEPGAQARDREVHAEVRCAGERRGALPIGQHAHVRACRVEPQPREVALEHPVHVSAVLALALRLLHVQARLLGDLQRQLLLRRLVRHGVGGLEACGAWEDLDVERPRAQHRDERVVLAPVAPRPQPRHRARHAVHRHQVALVVHAHLAVCQRHHQTLGHAHGHHLETLHAHDGGRQVDGEGLLPVGAVTMHHLVHAANQHTLLVQPHEADGWALQLDDGLRQLAVPNHVQLPVTSSDHQAVADLILSLHRDERRGDAQVNVRNDVGAGGIQDEHAPRLGAHDKAADGVRLVHALLHDLQTCHHGRRHERLPLPPLHKLDLFVGVGHVHHL